MRNREAQGGITILNKSAYENTRNNGIGVLEIVRKSNGKASEKQQEETIIFAPLKRTELKGDVAGPLASLRLTQTYSFTSEQCDRVLEARYRFPIPADASVTGVKVTFGDTELVTELKDRGTAKEDYKQAKREGNQAIMVTRESPDVFTICIAGLVPGEDVKVETSYIEMAKPEGTGWSLRIPLTTAPRYVRKDEFSSRYAHGQPLVLLRDPGHRFAMEVRFLGIKDVACQTHKIIMAQAGDYAAVTLQEGEVLPDRDCVLTWKPEKDGKHPTLRVICQPDEAANQTYFMAMIAPPSSKDMRKVPGEYIILVDHSGSMSGPKWAAADWAVEKFLLGLDASDSFALGVFHDTTKWLTHWPVNATEQTVQNAIDFLHGAKDIGGTELGVALEQALNIRRTDGNVSRHLLIITDAEVSDQGRLLRLVGEEAKNAQRRRISILCIDASPNSFLASQMAERGGGVAKFLTSNPEEEDISTALDSILEDWQQPVMTGLKLLVDRPGVDAISRESGNNSPMHGYVDLGDLAAGRTIWACGKFQGTELHGFEFKLVSPEYEGQALFAPVVAEESATIRSLYGASKVLMLELLIHSRYAGKDLQEQLALCGYDPEAVLYGGRKQSLYPENRTINEMDALRDFIVAESLNYGIISSETAFVAVYHKAGKKVEATAMVPNALPYGWSQDFAVDANMPPQMVCPQPATLPVRKYSSAPVRAPVQEKEEPVRSRFSDTLRSIRSKKTHSIIPDIAPSYDATESYEIAREAVDEGIVIFSGKPQFSGNEAVLFDSSKNGMTDVFKGARSISQLKVVFPGGAPKADEVDKGLSLLIYVGDMATPRAVVKIADLIRQRGVRPLNIRIEGAVKVVLIDPVRMWMNARQVIEVAVKTC